MRRGLRGLERRTVLVTTRDDRTFRGVLLGAHRDCLVLSAAQDMDARQTMAGEVVVPREQVHYVQTVEPEPT